MKTFLLEIVTPDKIAYSDQVVMVVVPTVNGAMGILPRHMRAFAQLIEGELKIKTEKDEYYLALGGGFIEITKEKVLILVTRAVKAHELNEQEIISAKKAAEAALVQKPSGKDLLAARILLRQSIVDMRILRKRKVRIH